MKKKKIRILFTLSFFLIMILASLPLIFSQQDEEWDWCIVSAYGINFEESGDPVGSFSFIAAPPPAGSDITNTVAVTNDETGENHNVTLNSGDQLLVSFLGSSPSLYSINPGSEPDHYIIRYEGWGRYVRINGISIPEFSPILFVPLFIALTLLVIIHRRKNKL